MKAIKNSIKTAETKSGIFSHHITNTHDTKPVKATGTCLGDCVKCGASCCMDAGHSGPHFCYLCK